MKLLKCNGLKFLKLFKKKLRFQKILLPGILNFLKQDKFIFFL